MKRFFRLMVLLLILFFGCDRGIPITPPQDLSNGFSDIILRIDKESTPTGIVKVVATLSRSGFDTLRAQLTIGADSAQGTFRNVPTGLWHLKVDALDGSGIVLYTGQTTIEVLPGRSVEVRLTLEPATGDVAITVSWGTGRAGNALEFDGVSGYVDVLDSPSLTEIDSSLTLEAWIKPADDRYYKYIICKGASNLQYTMELVSSASHPAFKLNGLIIDFAGASEYWGRLMLNDVIKIGIWTHVAVTYRIGDGINVYLNGNLVHHANVNGMFIPVQGNLRIGVLLNETYRLFYKGAIDEVRIWRTARDNNQIRQYMKRELTGSEPGLVAYWNFNDASGLRTVRDKSVYNNTGTLNGGVAFTTSTAF